MQGDGYHSLSRLKRLNQSRKQGRATMISQQYVENEAWLLFQLNDEPVHTRADGDFNVLAIMDVATGCIHAMEFLHAGTEEPSVFESRKLLNTAATKSGARPKYLLLDASKGLEEMAMAATTLKVEVLREEQALLDMLTEEARTGFAAHFMNGVQH